jgi:hypothetical protein
MVKVTCRIDNYDEPAKASILVNSHWNNDKLVVLEIEDIKITVKARDLETAIKNCTNTARY